MVSASVIECLKDYNIFADSVRTTDTKNNTIVMEASEGGRSESWLAETNCIASCTYHASEEGKATNQSKGHSERLWKERLRYK